MIRQLAVALLLLTPTTCKQNFSNFDTTEVCKPFEEPPSGHYTSVLATCEVIFFTPRFDDDASYPRNCDVSNGLAVYRVNLTNWPDNCVGDLSRCYSINHEAIPRLNHSIHRMGLVIPKKAKYVMVNCTEDKILQEVELLNSMMGLVATFGVLLVLVLLVICVMFFGTIIGSVVCLVCCISDCVRDLEKNRRSHTIGQPQQRPSLPTTRYVASGRYVKVHARPSDDMHSIEMQQASHEYI